MRLAEPRRRRRMALLRLAGFRAVGVTSFWEPGLTAPTTTRSSPCSRTSPPRRRRRPRSPSRLPRRPATTPLTAEARAQFASYAAAIARDVPELPRLHRRQRAEPEPLLAAAVQRGRHRRGRARLPLAARGDYDAPRRPTRTSRSRAARSRRAAIDRPGTGRDTHSPTRSSATSARPTARAGARPRSWTASRSIPTGDSSVPPDRPTDPASTSILLADYEEKLAPLLEEAFGPGLPCLYDEYGVETADPAREGVALRGHGAGNAGRRGDPGRLLPPAIELASCQPNVVGLLLFHSPTSGR